MHVLSSKRQSESKTTEELGESPSIELFLGNIYGVCTFFETKIITKYKYSFNLLGVFINTIDLF